MSYCSNCGQEMPMGARFCSGCGAAQSQPQQIQQPMQPQQPQPQPVQQQYGQPMQPQFYGMPMNGFMQPKKSKKPLIIILSILGVLCIAAAIAIPLILSGKNGGNRNDDKASSKRVLKEFFSAVEQRDYSRMVSVYLPEDRERIDDYVNEYCGGNGTRFMEDVFGRIRNVDWSVREVSELSDRELDELNEDIAGSYDEDYTATRAFRYTLEMTITYEDGETDTDDEDDIYVIKVGSRWYLFN